MSEFFGTPQKRDQLKQIVKQLHAGKSVSELKHEFADVLDGLSAEEIAQMEQELIDEGFGVESIQQLCNVHVEVFEDELKKQKDEHFLPGHPIYTYKKRTGSLRSGLRSSMTSSSRIRRVREISMQ